MKMTLGVGLLGCGNVGAAVADRLYRRRELIEQRTGVGYDLRAVAIRDPHKGRPESLDRDLFTRDARAIVDDPHVDLVIELIGGTSDAAELVERALDRGRHVVTANKDLLATQGPRLLALAASRGASLRFEGAVAGAIPIVRMLGESLAGDDVVSVAGVINGTCTSILAAMEDGASFAQALRDAQRLGYAEADPRSDIEGIDAAHKLALIAQLAFGLAVISPRIAHAGIAGVTRADVTRARMLGMRIRLVASAVRIGDGILADVAPVLVAQDHDFAATGGADNVLHVEARDAGRLVLRGAGAGGVATASAVLGDVVATLRALGERRDLPARGRTTALAPAFTVAPLYADARRLPELPNYPVWEDDISVARAAVCANA
jgi:homoserine dehydrogenase